MPTPSRPDPSRRRKAFVLAAAVAIVNLPLAARAATPSALLDGYRQAAGAAPSPTRGQQFFTQGHGREWSCSSCHGAVPTATGRHASTRAWWAALGARSWPSTDAIRATRSRVRA